MKVKCLVNKIFSLEEDALLKLQKIGYCSMEHEFNLIIGNQYYVYGIVFRKNLPFYYLCDDEFEPEPRPYPCFLFSLINSRLSKYWTLSVQKRSSPCFVFTEWAKDPMFYEDLVDGSPENLEVFLKYRKLIQIEDDEETDFKLDRGSRDR